MKDMELYSFIVRYYEQQYFRSEINSDYTVPLLVQSYFSSGINFSFRFYIELKLYTNKND